MTGERAEVAQPGQLPGPGGVVVVGTGLIGTSVALALRERAVPVWLADHDPAAARLAADMGAGTVLPEAVMRGEQRGPTAAGGAAPGKATPGGAGARKATPGGAEAGKAGRGKAALGAAETGTAGFGAATPGKAEARAAEAGAGVPGSGGAPAPWADLAVLAVPPAAVAPTLAAAQSAGLARWYTDVASVKSLPLRQARDLGCDLSTFVPGHPLSGRERAGPAAARADLFLGRPWVICPLPESPPAAVAAVTALARSCQAEPVQFTAAEHDIFAALVSHAPHVVAAAMAARLTGAPDVALLLAGQGLRDVTRIAGGDPGLWAQILAANAGPVADVLAAVAADLSSAAEALAEVAGAGAGPERAPSVKLLTGLLDEGAAGVARIPGKRGKPPRGDVVVQVVIPDQPGELARLFQVAGDAGVNIEDVGIEHSPGLPVGVAELTVRPGAVARLTGALAAAGWPVRSQVPVSNPQRRSASTRVRNRH